MMRILRVLLAVTLGGGGLIPSLPGLLPAARAAEIEEYQRKYISFYQPRSSSYDTHLIRGFRQGMPRFDYHLLRVAGSRLPLLEFLRLVKQYQQQNAGQLAGKKETDTVKFGDKVVTWSDTRRVMDSAYVMATDWRWGESRLANLRRREKNSSHWLIDLQADLDLTLDIYKLAGAAPELYNTQTGHWTIGKTYELSNFGDVLEIVRDSTGGEVDPDNPLIQGVIIEVLKQFPFYADLLKTDPALSLAAEAESALAEDSFSGLLTDIKRLNDFVLKSQIESADMRQDQVTVRLSGNESVNTLGIALDQGFKVIEYRLQDGREQPVEIGFTRVREFKDDFFRLQPIIVGRDYEPGDQMIEYPKTGGAFGLGLSLVPLGFAGQSQQDQVLQGVFDLEYSLAQTSGISELYLALTGGVAAPQQADSFAFVPSGLAVAPGATVIPFNVEVGLLKRWYMRQWILALGARVGFLGGSLLGSGFESPPLALGLGGTALLGLHYQATADMLLGFNLGWRYFDEAAFQTSFDSGSRPVAYPALISNGMMMQAFVNWSF
jgi:hypothetical protein